MADLNEAADTFARDLMNQNLAGLMMAFTPEGLGKAMMMQAQMQASGQPQRQTTAYEVHVGESEGEDTVVDIVMKNDEGEGIVTTRWRDVAGAWKVNDIALKPQA
jgi:hypothetical protein